jgi:hypothetical protein
MIQNGQNQINNIPQNNQISQSQPIPNGQNIQNQNNNEINKPLSNSYQNTNNIIKNIDNNLDSNKNKENQKTNGQELNKNIIGNEMSIEYENALREQIELSTPLISEQLNINILLEDYKNNFEYANSIKEITNKYKYIRKVRRDGNCFYRSFIYRLFEYICMKNDNVLYEKIKKKIMEAKDMIKNNGYDWTFIEDFYKIFYTQFYYSFNSLQTKGETVRDYIDALFKDKEAGNYLIYFIRFCIAAYLKENSFLYEVYVDIPFQNWITNEVEAIDHEADQIQIMACVNYFDIGVKIEYLNSVKNEVMKFPEDKPEKDIFITVLFTPGHYDILYG